MHGGVTRPMHHPHTSEDGSIVIAVSRDFENYLELKTAACPEGIKFKSETDSKVFAHLIEGKMDLGFEAAFSGLLNRFMDVMPFWPCTRVNINSLRLVVAPLIVGKKPRCLLYCLDVPAFLEYTHAK